MPAAAVAEAVLVALLLPGGGGRIQKVREYIPYLGCWASPMLMTNAVFSGSSMMCAQAGPSKAEEVLLLLLLLLLLLEGTVTCSMSHCSQPVFVIFSKLMYEILLALRSDNL